MNPHRLYFVWGTRVNLGVSSQNTFYLLPIPMGNSERKKKKILKQKLNVAIVVRVLASPLFTTNSYFKKTKSFLKESLHFI